MAVTYTVTRKKVYSIGDRKEVIADVSCSGQPTSGGDTLTGAALGLDLECNIVECSGIAAPAAGTSGVPVAVIHGTGVDHKLAFLVQVTAGAGNALGTYTGTLSSAIVRVRAVGKGKAAV